LSLTVINSRDAENNLISNINDVLKYEKQLRLNEITLTDSQIKDLQIEEYWKDIIRLFELKREKEYERNIELDIINSLDETFKYLYLNKFGV
jgi:thymidylate synthase